MFRTSSHSLRALSRLCRLNHHGWREKPGRLSASQPAKRFSAARRSPGHAVRTRRGAAFLALYAPRRTFEKRPFGVLYFSNSSRAVRGPFSNAATGSPFPPPPGIVSARLFDPAATRRKSRSNFYRKSRGRDRAKSTSVRTSTPNWLTQAKASFPFATRRLFPVCRAIAAAIDDCHRYERRTDRLYRIYVCRQYPSIARAIVFIRRLNPPSTESYDSASDGQIEPAGRENCNSNREFVSLDRAVVSVSENILSIVYTGATNAKGRFRDYRARVNFTRLRSLQGMPSVRRGMQFSLMQFDDLCNKILPNKTEVT